MLFQRPQFIQFSRGGGIGYSSSANALLGHLMHGQNATLASMYNFKLHNNMARLRCRVAVIRYTVTSCLKKRPLLNSPTVGIVDIRKGNGLATLFNTIHDLRFSYFE